MAAHNWCLSLNNLKQNVVFKVDIYSFQKTSIRKMDAGQAVIGEAEEGEAEVETMQTTSIVVSLQDPSTSSESDNLQNCTEGEATILPIQFVHLQNEGENQEQPDLPQEHVAETNNAVLVTEEVTEGVATPDKESLHVDSSYLVIPYPHQSIIKSVDDVSFDLCGDVECACGGQREVIHCSLCDVPHSWTNKDEATQHFISVHWESKLEIDEGIIHFEYRILWIICIF